ncbi:hypothetical protein DMC14_003195 [Metamycoplasma phocicerebrale]|uniref:ATP synthase gamma chain n=1 Tax=Metamycoplasma phocicerebrale TaxID=142649 RepID=A0A3Q9VBS3_9BACT|nr:hypothetical protein [Metamycoplasma phocicerebrale]AZZ65769.1 hypothetical protein DMC14_003195 [Metamycoplasma phocicerebrale]
MHLKKWEEKLHNLKNILTKVNSTKNILLINIMKLTKKLKFNISNALININLINSVSQKYAIKNKLIHNKVFKNKMIEKINKFLKKRSTLWIYLTENQKYSTDSYSRYEKNLLNVINKKHDDFIAIGQRANEFCNQNNLNIIKSITEEEKQTKNIPLILSQFIRILSIENNYAEVNFVLNTNRNYNGYFTILPIDRFDVNKLVNHEEINSYSFDITNYKIYPKIDDFIDNEINIFLENAIYSLIIESSFYNGKNDLVTTNKIINEIEEEIQSIKKKTIRIKREKEIEEIVLLTRSNQKNGGVK